MMSNMDCKAKDMREEFEKRHEARRQQQKSVEAKIQIANRHMHEASARGKTSIVNFLQKLL